MKRIIIKSMHIVNFKGVRDLSIAFDAVETDITGRNGSGKTSIFDAFTWLLFGHDSNGRAEFDIKTLDESGHIIYQMPHEVSAVINVDGDDIVLCRRLVEKWPKRNGKPTFTGNTVERLFNDVPCNEKEFDAKIAEICDDDTFQKITSPTHFVSQKADKQKADLLRMAGELSDADIAAGNPEFEMLLQNMAGKTFDEYGREIGAKKKRVNDELSGIPERIDERKRSIAENETDFADIESQIESKTAERDRIDAQLTDINAAAESIVAERRRMGREMADLKNALDSRRRAINETAMAEYRAASRAAADADNRISDVKTDIRRIEQRIESLRGDDSALVLKRSRMLDEYNALNKRANEIAAETLVMDENAFVCPTCHRPLDVDDIAAKQREMTDRFNRDKKTRADRIAAEINDNITAGRRIKSERATIAENIAAAESELAEVKTRLESITAERAAMPKIAAPDVEPLYAADDQIAEIKTNIDELQRRMDEPTPVADNDELKSERARLNGEIKELNIVLAKRDGIADDKKRIDELESQYRKLNDELTELEHIEYIIDEFSKAKSAAIDERINGLFNVVKFRWIRYLINGNERETCEATINGVPYSSLNTAGRITAGIDIINTICRFEGITAPIFIDNRESVTTIPSVESQIVNLIVSNDECITAKPHKSTL
nr:MAG TPA: chromosome partition protein [Caudoviricetes sp.]